MPKQGSMAWRAPVPGALRPSASPAPAHSPSSHGRSSASPRGHDNRGATLDLGSAGMKRLYLLRHAKSSWEDESLADHDRPLSARGRRAAYAVGRYLREHGIEPELVLCSSSTRTRETLARIGLSGQVEPGLYGASAGELLTRVRELPA